MEFIPAYYVNLIVDNETSRIKLGGWHKSEGKKLEGGKNVGKVLRVKKKAEKRICLRKVKTLNKQVY